ncbi:MAG: SRPBCC family protein [Bacteroidetes bacterium]|nr:SRPBCC family protein [Bacteroidota bacterium]
MKILKNIFLALISIVALLLLIALFTNKEYHVVRNVTINKSSVEVYDYIKYLKNQDNYSVWNRKDPNMKREYRGTDGTVGFVAAWDSQMEEVGKGEQEIIKLEEGKRIDLELRFIKPFEATDKAYMTVTPSGEGATDVAWGFDGKMPYPMNLMLLFMDFDSMLGPDLDVGLKDLKAILEK